MLHTKKSAPTFPLIDLAERLEQEACYQEYRNTFAVCPQGPYGLQWPGKDWTTRYKPVSDPLVKAHLAGKYWIALPGMYYPVNYAFDCDGMPIADCLNLADAHGLQRGQFQIVTSPGFWEGQDRFHILMTLRYKGKLPTLKLGYQALRNLVGTRCEVYPQLRRKFRAPLGRGQYLVDRDTLQIQTHLHWSESHYYLKKLEPIDIETLPFQPSFQFPSEAKGEDNPRRWLPLSQAAELWEHGLQAAGTRHQAQWCVAVWLYRQNELPENAIRKIHRWLEKKHNGFSKLVLAGDWRAIDAEISRQVFWIWENFRPYPDGPHNLERAITLADLKFAAEVFRGEVVNQKRLIALLSYVRPRAHHDWVYIPYWVWREIAHWSNYHEFIALLENKGLIECQWEWRHVPGQPLESYPRRFRVKLPATSEIPVQFDGRNAWDYYEALQIVCASVREMVELTGVAHQRFYQEFGKQK